MMIEDAPKGKIVVLLDAFIKERGISKNQASRKANISRTRFNKYCNNEIQRVDIDVLARLCESLGCEVSDLLRYVRSEK